MARIEDLFPDGAGEALVPAAQATQAINAPPRAPGLQTLKIPFPGQRPVGPTIVEAIQAGALPHPSRGLPPALPAAGEITVQDLITPPFAYLKGPAGTGKTYLARQIIQQRSDAILCATTGIAAVNLGDATTINALLGYFDTPSLYQMYVSGWLSAKLRKLRKSGVRIVVLDEVSMLPADQLTILCQAFDDVNLKKAYDASLEEVTESSEESLEMKLLLVGDFAQLPPVKADFAFQSGEWPRFADHTFTLDKVWRQEDRRFIAALQAVRKGQGQEALGTLESRIVPTLDPNFQGTTIVATNKEVDRINGMRHAGLKGELLSWKTIRSGDQQSDWIRLIPESCDVKIGALVMILANLPYGRDEEGHLILGYHYVNGELATVISKEDGGIKVMLHRTFEEVVVLPCTSEWREPTGKKKPPYTVKGAVTRMPLRLAYATTCHKSQGLSLDAVQVSISNWMFGKGGMLYVALSRCRSLDGLRIVGNAKMLVAKCTVDLKVKEYL